jgi:hypothetical protein
LKDIELEISLAYKRLDCVKLTILQDKKTYQFKDLDTFEFLETIHFLIDIQNKDALEKIEVLNLGVVTPFKTSITLSIDDKVYYLKYRDLKDLKKMDNTLSGCLIKNDIKID